MLRLLLFLCPLLPTGQPVDLAGKIAQIQIGKSGLEDVIRVFNICAISQAGRRGFESRLPLHSFNNLELPAIQQFAPFTPFPHRISSASSKALTA